MEFYDANKNSLGTATSANHGNFISVSTSGATVSITIDLSKCTHTAKTTAAFFRISGGGFVYYNGGSWTDVAFSNWNADYSNPDAAPYYALKHATLTSPGKPTLTISGYNIIVKWAAASGSGASGNIQYKLVYGNEKIGYGENITGTTTSTSMTVPFTYSGVQYGFVVVAEYGGISTESERAYVRTPSASITKPGNPSITSSYTQFTLTWSPATGSYGTGNVTYRILYGDENSGYSSKEAWPSPSTSTSISINVWARDVQCGFRVEATYSGITSYSDYVYATILTPVITAQPTITSISPTSGKSTTIKWSAATIKSQGNATIHYQYFVGPASKYSDSYYVGTTTNLSATITESQILAKCGSSFRGTCYLFVRAYWDNGSATGGWSTPAAKTFTYDPVVLSNPGNPTVSQSGSNYKVSWTAASGSGGTGNITYVVVVGNEGEAYQAGTATSISIAIPSAWYGQSIRFRVWAYYSGKETVCSSYTYFTAVDPVSLSAPGAPTLSQSANKLTVKWTSATGKGGSGSVSYQLYRGTGTKIGSSTTATTLTINVPSYDVAISYYVIASYSGKTAQSSSTSFTAHSPSVTAPTNVKISQSASNPTKLTISWTASSGSYGTGSITYAVGEGSSSSGYFESYYEASTNTSITINCPAYDTPLTFTVRASYSNGTISDTSDSNHVSFTPKGPAVTAPPNLSVKQSGTQVVVSWSASTGSFGVGNITYTLFVGTTSNYYASSYAMNTSQAKTLTPPVYDMARYYTIRATYSNGVKTVTNESRVSFTASSPRLTAPGKPVITQSGSQYNVSWTASTGQYGTGNITYVVVVGNEGEAYQAGTATSISIDIYNEWYDQSVKFRVYAYYGDLEEVSETGYYIATNHRTIMYNNGSSWTECIVYYFDGSNWIECVPYYYDGTSWRECG